MPLHQPAMKLRIKDKEYQHGLGHHASGEIIVDLAGQFQTFQAEVGIQWQSGQDLATAIFRVFVDDKKVFDSGVMREGGRAATDQDLSRRSGRVDAGGRRCGRRHHVRLCQLGRRTADRRSDCRQATADHGCGHRSVWPRRHLGSATHEGTAADRVQEIPAADIRLHRDVLPESDGTYRVPVQGESGCIGLRWDENRLLRQVALAFADAAAIPPKESIQLQIWSGESAWQGSWEPVNCRAASKRRIVWPGTSAPKVLRAARRKSAGSSRASKKPIVVQGLHAYSR